MYNDDVTRVPRGEAALWEVLREQFEFVRYVLYDLEVETREEALGNSFHRVPDRGTVQRNGMAAIRYRSIGADLAQLNHFLAMGRDLLPYIDQAIDERQFTPEFVQQWGKIMFCHGYVAAFVFDDSDDLTDSRKGQGGQKGAQKRWVAHILTLLRAAGRSPDDAYFLAGRYVYDLIKRSAYPRGFDEKWFRHMAAADGLATTYEPKNFYPKKLKLLVSEGEEGIPPIPTLAELEAFADPN